MTIRTLIVDDSTTLRTHLRALLQKLDDMDIIGEADNGRTALEMIYNAKPDLVFLDIKMPVLNGIEVARHLDQVSPSVIFVTEYDEYALQAHEVGPFGYLIKPVQMEKLIGAINRFKLYHPETTVQEGVDQLLADEAVHSHYRVDFIMVQVDGDFELIKITSIIALEPRFHACVIHFLEKGVETTLECDEPLERVYHRLPRQLFRQIHRRWVINVDYLKRIEQVGPKKYQAILNYESALRPEVSRRRFPWLKKVFNFIGDEPQ